MRLNIGLCFMGHKQIGNVLTCVMFNDQYIDLECFRMIKMSRHLKISMLASWWRNIKICDNFFYTDFMGLNDRCQNANEKQQQNVDFDMPRKKFQGVWRSFCIKTFFSEKVYIYQLTYSVTNRILNNPYPINTIWLIWVRRLWHPGRGSPAPAARSMPFDATYKTITSFARSGQVRA